MNKFHLIAAVRLSPDEPNGGVAISENAPPIEPLRDGGVGVLLFQYHSYIVTDYFAIKNPSCRVTVGQDQCLLFGTSSNGCREKFSLRTP